MDGWNRRQTRAEMKAIADILELIPKDGSETCHQKFIIFHREYGYPTSVVLMDII